MSTPVVLTRRGRVCARIALGVVLALSALAGATADSWAPCSGPYVCVLEVTP